MLLTWTLLPCLLTDKSSSFYSLFQQDVINLANEHNIGNIAIINFGFGQTNINISTAASPVRWQQW